MGVLDEIKSNINRNYFISASAGTGKTYTITHYYVEILNEYEKINYPEIVDEIVVATFTKKAASEMKERIFQLVKEKNSPYWKKIKNYLPRAIISTIDSFCQRILREENVNAKIDPNFTIISDLKMNKLIERSVYLTLKFVFQLYDYDKTDINLNISKLRKKQIEIILQSLKKNKNSIKKLFEIYQNIDEVENLLKYTLSNWRTEMKNATILEKLFETAKEESLALKAFKDMLLISKEIYEAFTVDNFEYDFKGILEKTLDILEDKNIRKKYQKRFKYIIIDEFQDTNYLQKELFDKLHTKENYLFYVGDRKQSIYRFRNSDVSVFLKTQNEFEENGEKILALKDNYRSNSELVKYFNFISKHKIFNKHIVQKTNNIDKYETFKVLEPNIYKKLWFDDEKDTSKPTIFCKGKVPSLNNKENGRIKYVIVSLDKKEKKEKKEALVAAYIIKKLVGKELTINVKNKCIDKKITYGDFAILRSRLSNAEGIYKEVFEAYNIPLHIVGGKSFYKQLEIQTILNALFAVQNPNNNYYFTRFFFSPLVLGKFKDYEKIVSEKKENETLFEAAKRIHKSHALEVLEKYAHLKYYIRPTEILKGLIKDLNYFEKLVYFKDKESAILNVKKLILEAENFDQLADSFSELIKLIQKIGDTNEAEASTEDETSESVKLMTIHASKGLEFKIVLLGDLFANLNTKNSKDLKFYNKKDKNYFMLTKIMDNLDKNTLELIKEFYLDEVYDETEVLRKIYVAITRASEMFIPIIFNENKENVAKYLKLSDDEIEELKKEIKSFEYVEINNVEIPTEQKKHTKEKEDIPQENLKDFSHLSYKSYISPTTLYGYLGNENEAKEEITLDLNEQTFKGSQIHRKLSNANTLSQLRYLEETGEIKVKLSHKIGHLFENSKILPEWRIVKPFFHKNRKYMLFGIPDKVIFKDNFIYILDFKNTKNLDDEKYIFQVNFYMYLLKDFGNVKEAYIISTKTGDMLKISYKEGFEEMIKKAIDNFEKVEK
ncbi:DNA helicase UvrD [Thermosipho affectus]|uniref:DNA 3'-5' helicase n=1 Tax=Thermosipho affectus TaxID=660294 RepID=A0ABX3IIB7_9BACT|nr:UvrD-helicase domain-containing protein [Thermosipho affectus]ONN27572.1 DNA helicase UvrD [Thermosipho affectus]